MAVATQVLAVPIPEDVELDEEDRERLEVLLRTEVEELRGAREASWRARRRALEEEGWTVSATLGWSADARRGRDHERALAATRAEAFEELYRLTRFDGLPEGAP
jgi:hypothetical protein